MNIIKNLVNESKYNIKCPNKMTATRIVVHNTYNDASARNEINYMINNNNEVSFHFAVDDKEIVQGLPLDRNSWNAGDGHGKGNMEGIAIEICYSKSGGDKFIKAEQNASKFIAQLLKERNWGIDRVTKHQDYSKKYCPHRTLDMGWDRFINMIKNELNPVTKKSIEDIAREVIAGKWGNGASRKTNLTNAGYNYTEVQNKVNELLGAKPVTKKSIDEIAKEVIKGLWGNGQDRKNRLTKAGYNYSEVQKRVNQLLK